MKKLLIVIDYQVDFVTGALGFNEAESLEEVIYNKINEYKKNKDDVIYTLDTHGEDYLETFEGKSLPVKHCIRGTDGHELYGKIKELGLNAIKFEKDTYPSLELGNYLKNKSYEIVELCGVVSNICVLSNAVIVKAALPNAKIIIDHQAVASYNDDLHEKSLDIMEGLHMQILNRNNS